MKEAVVPMDGNAYCHGLPGNADFLFGLSRALGNQQYADVGLQMIDTCLAQAVDLGDRLTWYQSGRMWNSKTEEWETDWEFPQIGFLTGNAGVGLALLHADALTQGRLSAVRLPDFPFPILTWPSRVRLNEFSPFWILRSSHTVAGVRRAPSLE